MRELDKIRAMMTETKLKAMQSVEQAKKELRKVSESEMCSRCRISPTIENPVLRKRQYLILTSDNTNI